MLLSMVLCTNFAKGQDHIIQDNSFPGTFVPTNFIKSNPYPAALTTSSWLEVGTHYTFKPTRGIFFGGNLGVTPDINHYGNYLGKWSFTGTWRLGLTSYYAVPHTYVPGINYLVNYHQWGDYAAHFGLRASSTYINPGTPYVETDANQKDAVISWSYEYGKDPNRLVFQTIKGVDDSGSMNNNVEYEWATILGNGNIGSGISNPTAQFQLKPLNPVASGIPIMEMLDVSSAPMFTFSELSTGGFFNTIGKHKITSPPSSTGTYENLKIVNASTTEIFKITDNGNAKIMGKLAINTTPTNDFDLAGVASIVGTLGVTGTSTVSATASGTYPILVSSSTTGVSKNLLYLGDKGTFYLNATTAATLGSPVKLIDVSRYTSPSTSSATTESLFSVDDLGKAFLPKYAAGYLTVGTAGELVTATTPLPNVCGTTGNNFGTPGTHTIGSLTSTTSADYVDFYSGNVKAFDITTNTSSWKHGFTNFVRNVSIRGGNTRTTLTPGIATANSEDWSLSISSSLEPAATTTAGWPGAVYSLTDYKTKGILRCINGTNDPILLVGGEQISFGHNCPTGGAASVPTTTFQFGDCNATGGACPIFDEFNLMNTATSTCNLLKVHGQTIAYQNVYPYTSNINLGLSGAEWANIHGLAIHGDDIFGNTQVISEAFMPMTGGVSDIGGPTMTDNFDYIYGNNLGDASNRFTQMYGDNIYVDQVIPMNLGGALTSDLGNSGNNFGTIWLSGFPYTTSDLNLKRDILDFEKGLEIIMQLKPKSYYLKESKENRKYLGFIAQEVNEILPSIAYQPKNEKEHFALSYTELIPVLTKAMQEQQAIIDSLKQKLDLIFASNQIKDSKNITSQKEALNKEPILFQNHPNPFNGVTFIDYFLPDNTTNAFLKVIDNNGKLVKAFPINKTGFGQVELDCSNLAQGTYYYTLLVNNQVIDTKNMIISKATDY